MLSCEWRLGDSPWYYHPPKDFSIFNRTPRKRCCSYKELINLGKYCLEFNRYRSSLSGIEEKIKGDEVRLASWFMCEKCGEIFLNLADIGYCHFLGFNLFDELKEYWNLTGFVPNKKKGD